MYVSMGGQATPVWLTQCITSLMHWINQVPSSPPPPPHPPVWLSFSLTSFRSGDLANICQLWTCEALWDVSVFKGDTNKLDLNPVVCCGLWMCWPTPLSMLGRSCWTSAGTATHSHLRQSRAFKTRKVIFFQCYSTSSLVFHIYSQPAEWAD